MMKLNVGLSRKVGEANYGSRGATLNVEVEMDSSLAADPTKLKARIRQLFALVRVSLAEELTGAHGHASSPNGDAQPPSAQTDNGNRSANGTRAGGHRSATASQVKAIHAIARTRRIDVAQFLNHRFQVARPDELSLRDASAAIDELKSPEGQGG